MRLNVLRFVVPLIAVAAIIGGGAMPAMSGDAPTAMIVLDGSGSMWGRLPPANRPKIDLVRQKLAQLLATPFSTRLGLVSFGHRRRGDCSDVELIGGPDSTRQDVLDPIAKLNPRGPGPLTAGLKLAMTAIGQSLPAQILVVGDNADNCQQDSCALAQEFAKTAPGVAIQVIGIGVPANERPRMACIAEATGGNFYDITDSNGLDAALDEATKLAILSPGAVAATGPANAKPTAPPPPEGASLRASAALAEGGALLTVPLKWRIYKAGGKTALGESEGPDISAKLSAGDYDVEAQLGQMKARKTITISDGDAQSIVLPLDAAHLVAHVTASKGGPPSSDAVLTLASDGQPISVVRGGSVDLYLPPADYALTVIDGATRSSQSLRLAAGDEKLLNVDLSAGHLDVVATKADGSALQDVLYTVEADDPESPDGRRDVAQSRDPHASFTLPEGTYYVTARSGSGSMNKRIAVGAGQTVSETLSLALVHVTISALVAGAPAKADQNIFYRVERIDGDRVGVAQSLGPALALDLSPGRYRISASLAASHLSASNEVVIAPGKPVDAVIDIASGRVDFAPPPGAPPVIGDVYWEVSDQNGMAIWRATGAEATAILAPGQYTVHFDARDSHGQAAFEVRAGQSQKIEIGPG
ncbi:MAG: VWA domain-containing protein [Proteobacteria bacterium]|nr:VWA domain-containing protein [Pseudomonadota bacterium]